MGKIATIPPPKTFTASMIRLLQSNEIFGSAGTNSWLPDLNHRDVLINDCLGPTLQFILKYPMTDINTILHSMTNTDLVFLSLYLSPRKNLQHLINLGIICRSNAPKTNGSWSESSINAVIGILTMSNNEAEKIIAKKNNDFLAVLPKVLDRLAEVDKISNGQSFMLETITHRTAGAINTLFDEIEIPDSQKLQVRGHTKLYGMELLSLQEKLQFTIDSKLLLHSYENGTQDFNSGTPGKPTFSDWFNRSSYLGNLNSTVYSINQILSHIKSKPNKVEVSAASITNTEPQGKEKTIMNTDIKAEDVKLNTKHCSIQGMDNLFLNLRLALMATNTIEREVLVRADNETLLRLAAESIDPSSADITSFTPFYTYGDVGYSRSACIELIHANFDTSYKELSVLSDTEIADYMNSHFANEDDDDDFDDYEFDRDEAIETLVEAGHKKAKLKKMDDDELQDMLLALEVGLDGDD